MNEFQRLLEKPHLKKMYGRWWCATISHFRTGDTIHEAYNRWVIAHKLFGNM